MASEQYELEARIELNAPPAVKALNAVNAKMGVLAQKLKQVNLGTTGMVGKLAAAAGAYFGINMLIRGVMALGRSMFTVSSDVETMGIALAAVYSAVEKISFSQAIVEAGELRKRLQVMAIESVGTTQDLAGIFQGIYGPLRRAGLSADQLLKLTKDTASAAAALNIDFAQTTRDISLMSRGLAGAHVKTFSMLQSMGLITETAKQFNELAPDKRAKRLMEALGKMGGEASEAYARTWAGLSSTFKDIMMSFKRAFGTAIFERLKATLLRINTYLLKNRELIEGNLMALGERVGAAFDFVLKKGYAFYNSVVANIDSIRAKIQSIYDRFQSMKPLIEKAEKFALTLGVASLAFNTVAPILGLMVSALSMVPVVVSGLVSATAGLTYAFGVIATKVEMLAVIFQGLGSGAALSALGASISAAAAAAAAAIVPILIVVAAIVAVVVAILRYKDTLLKALAPLASSLKSIGSQLYSIFKDLWASVKPILEVLGGVAIIAVIAALRVLAWCIDNIILPPFRILGHVTRWLVEHIVHPITELLDPAIRYAVKGMNWLGEQLQVLVDAVGRVIKWIDDKIGWVGRKIDEGREALGNKFGDKSNERSLQWAIVPALSKFNDMKTAMAAAQTQKETAKKVADILANARKREETTGLLTGNTPMDRPNVTNDFRGSKIEIKQEFRQADPDNVWVQVREGLEQEALARTQSGFANALGR